MSKAWMATVGVVLAGCVAGCAADAGAPTQAEAYEANEPRTGSNIPSREKRLPSTPEERERARAQAEAIRNSQNPAGMPRPETMPRTR